MESIRKLEQQWEDDWESTYKNFSMIRMRMKREEKTRVLKEVVIVDALFTFKYANKDDRIIFEKLSYELMCILSPNFEWKVNVSGNYIDISNMYISYFTHIANHSKISEIEQISYGNT